MQILLKLFLLLISIDQETVLNFFGIEDPNAFLSSDFGGASVTTEISFNTLKVIFQGLLEQYQQGLGLIEIENILIFITFIRFIILANRYNIKTSFYMCGISFFAGFLWYSHLKDMTRYYGPLLTYNRFTGRYVEDMLDQIYIEKGKSGKYGGFLEQNPISFIKSSFVYASERDSYRIDPISMLFARVPEQYKQQTDQIYYSIFNHGMPGLWKFAGKQITRLGPIILYVFVVRLNKRYCPYLIRWHWTYLIMMTVVEGEITRVLYRLYFYVNLVLVPSGRFSEAFLFQSFFTMIISVHFLFIYLAMLHAVCGQYFYIPFITENTEIHIGRRPKNSIYSGGYTSWQEGNAKKLEIMAKDRKFFALPTLWWGWLGKKRTLKNKNEAEFRKRQQNRLGKKQTKGFKKLIRKLTSWFSRN
jgi:hypothetical protein